jgi:hypothetical protein
LIIYCFTSRSRIFHLYEDVTIAGEGLQNLGLCSALRAFEQGGIFIVSENAVDIMPTETQKAVSVKNSNGRTEQNNGPTFIEIADENKTNFIENMSNKNTIRKTQSAVRQFTTWLHLSPRHEMREIN